MTMELEDRIAAGASTLDSAIDSYTEREHDRPARRRLATVAASAVLLAGGVAAIAAIAPRSGEPRSAGPVATAAPITGPTVPAATSAPVAGPTEPEDPQQARLRTYAMALLLDSGLRREEMVAFLSENVPESEVRTCMEDAGFAYSPGPSPKEEVDADVRFTMAPHEYAAAYGLGIAGWDLGLLPRSPEPGEPAPGAGDAAVQVLAGCRGIFDPERRATSDAVNAAVGMFRVSLDNDQRTVTALAEWRSCMEAAGFEYGSPQAMRGSFYARITTGEALEPIFADEVAVAVANVPCEAAYSAVVRTVIDDRFHEFTAMFDAALASGLAPDAQG